MGLRDAVDVYCERVGPGWLAEPLNALSNLAFLYAAWVLWRAAGGLASGAATRQRGLAGLVGLVGLGSLSFHTLATRWAGLLDVIFIGVFEIAYLIVFLRSVARWPLAAALAAGAGFVAIDRLAAGFIPAQTWNGSVLYLPALLVLGALSLYAARIAPAAARAVAGALAVFAVSLGLRTVDQALCAAWPWGTHFAWHLCNAWVLLRLTTALTASDASAGVGRCVGGAPG